MNAFAAAEIPCAPSVASSGATGAGSPVSEPRIAA
jgi:hypothetical protein